MILKFNKFLESVQDSDWEYYTNLDGDDLIDEISPYLVSEEELEQTYSDIKSLQDTFRNFGQTVTLYRIISLHSGKILNTKDLGRSYVLDKSLFQDWFFDSIGLIYDKPEDLKVITVEVDKDDIDYQNTIERNVEFPDEREIHLKSNIKPKVISVDNYHE